MGTASMGTASTAPTVAHGRARADGGPETGPLDRWRPRLFLALALGVVVIVGTLGASRWQHGERDLDVWGFALVCVAPVVVGLLPRPPALAVVLAVGAIGTYLLLGYPWGPALAGPVLVLVTVLLSGPARRARAVAWTGAGLFWGVVLLAAALRDDGPVPAGLLGGAAWTAVALMVAAGVRERVARTAAWRAAREERERTAVATERLRIARELHDVLAHSLSAINVQAGVGLHLLDRDPDEAGPQASARARATLSSIKTMSHDALDEVRAVLGVVRREDDTGGDDAAGEPRSPTWDLDALPRLAEPLRARGVVVRFDVDDALGPGGTVPTHLAGVAFRVVQEALTNVGRHAPDARRVDVRVRRDGGSLHVRVADDGTLTDDQGRAPAPGYGLRGMRERVEGAGGTLATGPGAQRGYVVDAYVPLVGQDRPAPTTGPDAAPRDGSDRTGGR